MNRISSFSARLPLLLVVWSATAPAQQSPSPLTTPEIVAQLPSGHYVGEARGGSHAFELSLLVADSKPGGRFSGAVFVRRSNGTCSPEVPITGEMKPNGSVQVDSAAGVSAGCQKRLNLKLAGSELAGILIRADGTYEVKLKRIEKP